jgi:hypothetical protein
MDKHTIIKIHATTGRHRGKNEFYDALRLNSDVWLGVMRLRNPNVVVQEM